MQVAFYIMADEADEGLYHGCSDVLALRIRQNRGDLPGGSTHCLKHRVVKLVYYEFYENRDDALAREKRVKRWKREWKTRLVESLNPEWRDLFDDIEM